MALQHLTRMSLLLEEATRELCEDPDLDEVDTV